MQQKQQSFPSIAAPILMWILVSEMLVFKTEIFKLKLEKNHDLTKFKGS